MSIKDKTTISERIGNPTTQNGLHCVITFSTFYVHTTKVFFITYSVPALIRTYLVKIVS